MKQFSFGLFAVLLFSQSWALACDLNGIDLGDEDDNGKYSILSDKDASFADKDQFDRDLSPVKGDFVSYADCKDSMIWRVLRAKNTGKVFEALMSDEDGCDGGNSYGVLYFDHHVVGTIEDSVITCK